MVANVGQKIKFKNSQGNNFLMIPQSSDKTWECPPQIAAPADKKRFPTTTTYYGWHCTTCFSPVTDRFSLRHWSPLTVSVPPRRSLRRGSRPARCETWLPVGRLPPPPPALRRPAGAGAQRQSRSPPAAAAAPAPLAPRPPPPSRLPRLRAFAALTAPPPSRPRRRRPGRAERSGAGPRDPGRDGTYPAAAPRTAAAPAATAGAAPAPGRPPGSCPRRRLRDPGCCAAPLPPHPPRGVQGGRGGRGEGERPRPPGRGRRAAPSACLPAGRGHPRAALIAADALAPPRLSPQRGPFPPSAEEPLPAKPSLFSSFFFFSPFPGTTPFLPQDTASAPARRVAELIRAVAACSGRPSPRRGGGAGMEGRVVYDSWERRLECYT